MEGCTQWRFSVKTEDLWILTIYELKFDRLAHRIIYTIYPLNTNLGITCRGPSGSKDALPQLTRKAFVFCLVSK